MNLKPVSKESSVYVLEVLEGETFNGVIEKLAEDNIIKSKFASKLYAKLSNQQNIAAGRFFLDPSMSTKEIIKYLNETLPSQDVVVKLDDGSWAKDIAQTVSDNINIEKDALLDAWNDVEYIETLMEDYDFLTNDIFDNMEEKHVLLEGFLYPDTYHFDLDSPVDTITRKLLDNLEEKLASIQDEIEASDFNIYELITFSSIIMYEAASEYDQKMVSGVFRNRLDIDMPLQSSVTVCYTLYEFDDWTECELFKNQAIESPYNTYINKGLPIGPILNPNIHAIENTLNYTENEYLFFVADVYEGGDGTVYYTKTYEEHMKKVNELRNR